MGVLDGLDEEVVPASAAILWDLRGEDNRDLNDLVEEYTAAVSAGGWTPAPKTDAVFPELSNAHCEYLPEFSKIKWSIEAKHEEV